MNDILQLTIVLIASLIATLVSRRLKIPAVVGQMLVGILIAPSVLGLVHSGHVLEVMSEIGVILLMFLAGIESDLTVLKKNFKASMLVAVGGVIVPLIAFGLVAFGFGYGISTSFFYGIVFAATSVSITVEVLQEYGSIILGAAVVDDILAVLILSIFTSFKNGGSGSHLFIQFLLELLFFAFLFLVHKLIPRFWKFVQKLPIANKNTIVALIICLGLSLLADSVGMSAVIGSFFAGLAISQTEVSHKIEEYTSAIGYVIFIPVFFVLIAISVQFDSLIHHPWTILLFTFLAILTKFIPAYFVGKASKLSTGESMLIGTGMISRGEMALIVAQIGLTSAIITDEVYSELVIVIILATVLAPFLIKMVLKKYDN